MTATATATPYGYCPTCGAPGKYRERRFNGDDHCENGHAYPSKSALTSPPPDTTPTKVALPPVRTYSIMSDAVERGIAYGYNRAHKHTDKPAEETIRQQIHDAVMLELTEVFDFGDEGDES